MHISVMSYKEKVKGECSTVQLCLVYYCNHDAEGENSLLLTN